MKGVWSSSPKLTTDLIRAHCKVADSGCWEWSGSMKGFGYGQIYYLDEATQRKKRDFAHRASYIAFKGPVPNGLIVLHSCDNRKCVNPEHLSAGTESQNKIEMWERGGRA